MIKSGKSRKNKFYKFIEEHTVIAKKLLTDKDIVSVLSRNKLDERKNFNMYGKSHPVNAKKKTAKSLNRSTGEKVKE